MKHKKSTALLLALLMMVSVFSSATSVFAESKQEAPGVNQLVKKVEKVKFEDKKDSEKTEAKEELNNNDGLEISGEDIPEPVGFPADFDLSSINTIAKDNAGNYYGVRTYNSSFDTGSEKVFYSLTKDQYDQVAKDCFMVFKEENGAPFEIPRAKIGTNDIAESQPIGTDAGKIFTELQFRHHMAYRFFFFSLGDPTIEVASQKDWTWSIELKKDWIIEPYDGFGGNSRPDYAYIHFNANLDGKGHTIKRNDANDPGIFQIGPAHSGAPGSNKTVTIKNLNIDGGGNYFGILLRDTTTLNLENTHISNCKADLSSRGGGITLFDDTVLNTDAKSSISNCVSERGGAIKLSDNVTVNINGSNISNNQAVYGGAICSLKNTSVINIKNAKLADNTSSNQGGAIYANSRLNIDGSEFTNNSTSYYGGAIMNFMDTKIAGSTFSKNKANSDGGAIYQSGTSKLTIENSNFSENECNRQGGAVFVNSKVTAKLQETKFSKNKSLRGGGAIYIKDNNSNEVEVSKCNFEENSSPSGGCIYLGEKSKLKVDESNFEKNQSNYGGAIYTNPYEYADPITNKDAYKNLRVDDKTLFKGNKAEAGLFSPPSNYADFTHLKFDPNSDVDHGVLSRKSLLNNYDVNYKNPNKLIIYDANGGKFADGTKVKYETYPVGEKIEIMAAPTREGYKFLYWSEPEYKPGGSYTVKDNHTFVAQWEADPTKPDPNKPDKPAPGGGFYFVPTDTPLLNRKDHAQYMIGYPDQNFKPDNHMSRQEVTVMFSRLLNERPQKGVIYSRDYKDIPDDLWSVTAISYMSKLGMVKGYPDGNFMPRAAITRAEFAAMATRFADISAGSKTFTDVSQDHWAYDVIQKAAAAGWISGYPDGSFKPDQPITRAEVVAITNRMLNRFADEAFVDAHQDKILQFKDMNKGMWSYYPVVEATNGHGYERKANGKDETWFEVNGTSFVYDK